MDDATRSGPGASPDASVAARVPRLPRTFVPRLALWRRLDAAVGSAIITLVAPAGAGKTLGVAGWLHDSRSSSGPASGAVTWLHASPGLDDIHLAAVLASAAPQPDVAGSRPRLVVIDDAHDLPASAVRLLDERLNDAPQDLRVLLLARWDLPLTRLAPQLLGHLTDLRGDVLRLSDAESARLIHQHVGPTAPEVVAAITSRAEGWCSVVVLASRFAAASPDPLAAVRRMAHGNSKMPDQVASEVFATLTPRERHLLLCTAGDGEVSAETAVHLTHDPGAGLVLEGLESTGLLVTRLETEAPPPVDRDDREARATRFRIHPLLVEVVRRRVRAGGVDVERARATVLRAVRLDVGRGSSDRAFGRLVDLGLGVPAAEQLAIEGSRLLMHGRDKEVVGFAERWPDVVELHPETWFVLALERWVRGDIPAAVHWLDRLVSTTAGEVHVSHRLVAQCLSARLMRARAGFEPLAIIAQDAQDFVDSPGFASTPSDLQPHVLGELGIVQSTLGLMAAAEGNLLRAARLGEELALPAHVATALAHLAAIYYMRGREHVALKLATRSLEAMPQPVAGLRFPRHRAELFAHLSAMATLPLPTGPDDDPQVAPLDGPVHPADTTTRFWEQIHHARIHLVRRSVIQAERTLQSVIDVPGLPDHLRAALLIERGFLAALCDDRRTLSCLTAELDDQGWPGEALLLRGVASDLAGDLRMAVDHLGAAAETVALEQPPCRALALTCRSQLLRALGYDHEARSVMLAAVRATDSRGNYIPFLGWSRHGGSVHSILSTVGAASADPWLAQLTELTAHQPDITAAMAPWTATAHERRTTPEPLVTTRLSPRERDVLRELARGATYADIAAGLFVSENTVKTHVSSLYRKLGASRRSEALSVARRLELL